MDGITLKKYFHLGDDVEISFTGGICVGTIVDFSSSVLVIEDNASNPYLISVDSILSCKKKADSIVPLSQEVVPEQRSTELYKDKVIIEAISTLDSIYDSCTINRSDFIKTNAVVVEISPSGVCVLTDAGQKLTCAKSGFVGYSKENAAIGKRVFCSQSNSQSRAETSYASITEMTYGELYDSFVKAINVTPKPRTPILGSILFYLGKEYGNTIHDQKKVIKQIIRKLISGESESSNVLNNPVNSTRLKVEDLTDEQILQISDLLRNHIDDLSLLRPNDQIIFADKCIFENLGVKVRRVGVKAFVQKALTYNVSDDVATTSESPIADVPQISQIIEDDPFISATCEIRKYYNQHKNGNATDGKIEKIWFTDDIVVDESLLNELKQFKFWETGVTPIPAVCSYRKGERWTANFIMKPCSVSEMKNKISSLIAKGKKNLANSLQQYIEGLGYVLGDIPREIEEISSEDLLKITRRQRLIKNFEDAETGFLELIRRNYEFDAVIRDLAAMYQEWESSNKAIELLEKYLPQLEEKIKTYNQLSLLYQSIGDYGKAISAMENALKLIPGDTKNDQTKRNKLQKRIDLVKKKHKKGSSSSQGDNQVFVFSFTNEDIPSPLIRYDANNASNEIFTYIKDKSTEEKLQFVNSRIGQMKDSPELPSYILAKIQLLEDGGETGSSKTILSLLADYCKAKARNYFNEDNIISAREYLLQGISIFERDDLYNLLYLSLCCSSRDVLSMYNTPGLDYNVISSKYSIKENDDSFYVILRIINEDSVLSRRFIKKLYESECLTWMCDELDAEISSPTEFINAVVRAASDSALFLKTFEQKIDKLLLQNNAFDLSRELLNVQALNPKQLPSSDITNFSVIREVANYALDFERNLGYDESDEICRNAFEEIDNTTQFITRVPTRVSTLKILPVLLKLKDLLERELNRKYTETLPHIEIEPIDDARPVGNDVEIQISIKNDDGSSRANNCVLSLKAINGKDISHLSLSNTFESSLLGGVKLNTTFVVRASFIESDNLQIDYTLNYIDVRKVNRSNSGQINLSINKGDDYEDFENPYIAHVKSNAVKDKSMFKGRDEIINTICTYILEDYKGYVLYGQKRSGKSSVLYHITQRLRSEHKAFAVEYTMGNNIVQDSESENESMANLFYTITSEIGRAIKEVDRNVYKECGCRIIRRQEFDMYPDKTFSEYLEFYRDIIIDKLHYEQDKIVLIVDEFTYLYYHILEKKISPRIMEFWKGLIESKVFSFVFAGQDAMPRFMDEFQNIFASMHPQELTYIDEQSARELIEEPIWNHKKECSRFHPDAVNKILELTACSPFYIMILCSELVKFARQRKRLPIQANDVDTLVQKMICNESSISRKDFDNLISCGEARLDIIDKDDSIKVLKDIALKSRNIEFYDVNEIKVFDKEKVKNIINDLLRRRVLEPHPDFGNKVRIKVGLFKRWLLNHE